MKLSSKEVMPYLDVAQLSFANGKVSHEVS
jgi:hypothetical protein